SFSLSLVHRIRYEALDDQFRVGRAGDDDLLALRTLLHGQWRATPSLTFGVEIADSRAYLQDPSTPVGTSIVNAVELLQAYADLHGEHVLGGRASLRIGRLTMNLGSRRFVSRNRSRNTINGFTGFDGRWNDADGHSLRAFYLLPLRRRPADRPSLDDDDVRLDEESFDIQLWGLHGGFALPWGDRVELQLIGLHEEAGAGGTRNRDLYSPGLRLLRKPARGRFDYQLESVVQLGRSRAGATSTVDLDHRAHFHHVEVGYSFDAPWSPRVALQYDHASGDEDPNDRKNERFDTLFGSRRFDFGPTSIYGAFARGNLSTPGLRIQVKPGDRTTSFVALRGFWLAERRDAWTTSGVRDPAGRSGRYVGSQIDFRLRYDVVPGNVRLETGFAHLFDGGFVKSAPNSNRQGDTTYGYLELTFRL
ncbi:MAG: alginate export family protein, partial [Myxococcales bacterium]|nr:alginate export family protein [Myxococcales bacterium]